MLKNLKLKRVKLYVVDLIDGMSIALNILFGGTLRKQYPAALSGPLKVVFGESSAEYSTRYLRHGQTIIAVSLTIVASKGPKPY